MITRLSRGRKILGFAKPIQMQRRYTECPGMGLGGLAVLLASIVAVPSLTIYLTYKSFSYVYNNDEIVRKDKTNNCHKRVNTHEK